MVVIDLHVEHSMSTPIIRHRRWFLEMFLSSLYLPLAVEPTLHSAVVNHVFPERLIYQIRISFHTIIILSKFSYPLSYSLSTRLSRIKLWGLIASPQCGNSRRFFLDPNVQIPKKCTRFECLLC